MDTLFECRYTHTVEMDREFYRYWFYGRPIMIVLYLCAIGGFLSIVLLDLLNRFANQNLSIPFDISYLIIPAALLVFYLAYRRSVDTARKRNFEITNGNALEIQISMTSEQILYETSISGKSREIPLSSIKQAVNLKSQFVLVSDAKMLYSFRKDSFTKGTVAEMTAFLKQKGLFR